MGEITYSVFRAVPYEGQYVCFSGTLAELTLWFQGGHDGYDIKDLDIYQDTNLDKYDLAQQC